MSEQTDKMNYCCDCGWAVKKGLFFKKRHCTCPKLQYKFLRDPVTGLCKNSGNLSHECERIRNAFDPQTHLVNFYNSCPHFEEKSYALPRKNPLPCPPLPERVEKVMEEVEEIGTFVPLSIKDEILIHGKPLGDFVIEKMQKIKDLKEENKRLKEAKEELVSSLKDFCGNFNITQLCSLFKRGEKRCIYSEKEVCAICKTIQKHDLKDKK